MLDFLREKHPEHGVIDESATHDDLPPLLKLNTITDYVECVGEALQHIFYKVAALATQANLEDVCDVTQLCPGL